MKKKKNYLGKTKEKKKNWKIENIFDIIIIRFDQLLFG